MSGLRALLCVAAACLGGCTTTRIYPICLYNSPSADEAKATWQRSKGDIEGVLAQQQSAGGARSVATSIAAVVTADPSTHDRLSLIWPSVGCIGSTQQMPTDDVNLRTCQKLIADYIQQPWTSWPGDPKYHAPACFQVD